MNKKNLIKSGLIYTIGNVLLQGLAFITLPIYTRVISQEVYGEYSLYTSWVTIISLFIGLQTSGSLTIAKVKYPKDYTRYSAHAFSVSNLFFLVTFGIILFFQAQISELLGFSKTVVIILFFQSYATYVCGFFGQYFIQLQRATANLMLSAFIAISSTFLSIFLIFKLDDDFIARVIGGLLPLIIMVIITYVYIYSKGRTFIRKEYLSFTLAISIPLIFHHLGHQVLNQLDRLMIGTIMTSKDVALYSFGYNMGMIIQIVLGNINIAWIPWFFEARKKKDPALQDTIRKYLSIAVFLTLGYLTIFPEFSQLMGGEKYSEANSFIPMIIVSYFFSFLYTFPVNVQFFYENTKMVPVGTLIAGGINAGMNLLFIPRMGIYGAAISTALSYFALLVIHHYISKKKYDYRDVTMRTYINLSLIVIIYALLMNIFVDYIILRWGVGLIILSIYYWYFYSEIKNFILRKRGKK
ncbi:TPA: oligosaccharide flippase family protein [Streptococcus suis]